MNSLIIFSKCIQLCTHHHNPVLKHSTTSPTIKFPGAPLQLMRIPTPTQATPLVMTFVQQLIMDKMHCNGSGSIRHKGEIPGTVAFWSKDS